MNPHHTLTDRDPAILDELAPSDIRHKRMHSLGAAMDVLLVDPHWHETIDVQLSEEEEPSLEYDLEYSAFLEELEKTIVREIARMEQGMQPEEELPLNVISLIRKKPAQAIIGGSSVAIFVISCGVLLSLVSNRVVIAPDFAIAVVLMAMTFLGMSVSSLYR